MTVQCDICPRQCVIPPGGKGNCRVRVNLDGKLRAVTYGYPCSAHVDPVEKKPVYHFLPSTPTFSIATVGCNLHCKNCQNWEISQAEPEQSTAMPMPPAEVVRLAQQHQCPSISYTYTDPIVFYEYTLDTCKLAHEAGLRNIVVTAGYINPKPARELFRHVDVARFDLKFMSDERYREICGARLAPILEAIKIGKELCPLVEIIHLVIPTLNDRDEDLKKLCAWVAANLGPDTPLHFSRFYPQYRLQHLPPTPVATLNRAREIARAAGLRYVYLGNVMDPTAGNTQCPQCGKLLLRRVGFEVTENHLRDGACGYCGTGIHGIWK